MGPVVGGRQAAIATIDPATIAPAIASCRSRAPASDAVDVGSHEAGTFSTWPSTCTPIAPNQTMKLALCRPRKSPRCGCDEDEQHAGAEEGERSRRPSSGATSSRMSAAAAPWRRTAGVAKVVAREAPAGARQLQQNRRDQQQPEEDVQGQLLPDEGDRRSFGRKEHEQHDGIRCRQARVPLGPAALERVCAARSRRAERQQDRMRPR